MSRPLGLNTPILRQASSLVDVSASEHEIVSSQEVKSARPVDQFVVTHPSQLKWPENSRPASDRESPVEGRVLTLFDLLISEKKRAPAKTFAEASISWWMDVEEPGWRPDTAPAMKAELHDVEVCGQSLFDLLRIIGYDDIHLKFEVALPAELNQ